MTMQLRMADVLLARLAVAPRAPQAPAFAKDQWQRQLAFACERMRAGALGTGGSLLLPVQEGDHANELESCGMPAAAGLPPGAPHALAPVPAAAAADAAVSQAPPHASDAAFEHVPVRVHVDAPEANGMTVWLGLDRAQQPTPERAARIVADLRQVLHATPGHLAAVVCNGVTVYAAAAPFAARPQRAAPPSTHAFVQDLP